MRILEVTDFYPPPVAGGRELRVQMLSHEFSRRGHAVEVLTMAGAQGPSVDQDGSIIVRRLSGWSRLLSRHYANPDMPFHPTLPDPAMSAEIADHIRRFRPDVVHVHSWMLYSILSAVKKAPVPIAVWMHDYEYVCPRTTLFFNGARACSGPATTKCLPCAAGQYGFVKAAALTAGLAAMKKAQGRVDKFVAVSRFVATSTAPYLSSSDTTVDVIPNFVPGAAFEPAPGRPAFVPQEGDYFMYAGALAPHKGIDVLLDAWQRMSTRVPLVLAGIRKVDTPDAFPVGVVVAKNVPFDDVLRGWRHSLAAIVPSIWSEPCPSVVLEAMAAGTPVIASAVGGVTDLVNDGTSGILVPPGDAEMLASAMDRMVVDETARSEMGRAGRALATNHTLDVVASRWESVFAELVR